MLPCRHHLGAAAYGKPASSPLLLLPPITQSGVSPLSASSASSVEAVGGGDLRTEDGAASMSVASSSCTSSSSSLSISLRMMILPSSGGPRTSRLRSPKSLLVNSSSHEVSGMRPPHSKIKTDQPLGPSQKDHLAQTPVSKGGARKCLTGTLVVVEIQTTPVEALSHRSMRKSPP
jgi:hypothetical protein